MNSSRSFFDDIQKQAEAISARLNHYYLGVEHLFMALVNLEDGQTAAVLKQHGVPPEFVRYAIEVSLGQALDKRYWRGFRTTPRYEKVLTLAQKLESYDTSSERALLLGILNEGQGIPVRHLRSMGVDIDHLRESIANLSDEQLSAPPHVTGIASTLPVLAAEKALLREIFDGANQLTVTRDLNIHAGFTTGRVYAVQQDEQTPAKLVRFDSVACILQEKRRFDDYVDDLPPISMWKIAVSSDPPLGAALYDSPLNADELNMLNSKTLVEEMGGLPQRLYDGYADWFWGERERYQFELWREYETVLPPALVVDVDNGRDGDILKPLASWSRDRVIFPNSAVTLAGFTVNTISPQTGSLTLCAGPNDDAANRSSLVSVMGFSPEQLDDYAPGQHINSLAGRVRRTRQGLLFEQIAYIRPNFDPAPNIIETPVGTLPNPLMNIPLLLQHPHESYLSLIHGNLHSDFIALHPSGELGLIDFSQIRIGHTLFDWAMLELSLLESKLLPFVEADWGSVWSTMRHLESHLSSNSKIVAPEEMAALFDVIAEVRQVAAQLLGVPGDWREYNGARALLAIARLGQTTAPLAARRMLFASAAFAVDAFLQN